MLGKRRLLSLYFEFSSAYFNQIVFPILVLFSQSQNQDSQPTL